MRTSATWLLFGLVVGLSDCASTMRVYGPVDAGSGAGASTAKRIRGLPFFGKKGICKQTTIYELRTLKVAITADLVDGSGKPLPVPSGLHETVVVDGTTGTTEPALASLRAALADLDAESDARAALAKARAAWNAFRRDTLFDLDRTPAMLAADGKHLQAASANTTEMTAITDYSAVYFVNGAMPWFGSSTVKADLANDGTLTHAEAQAESKAADLLGFLPIKEALTAKWVPKEPAPTPTPGGDAAQALRTLLTPQQWRALGAAERDRLERSLRAFASPPAEQLAITLSTESGGFAYTLTKLEAPRAGRCVPAEPLPATGTGYSWVRTPLASAGGTEKPKPEGKSATVSLSGAVQLPPEKQ